MNNKVLLGCGLPVLIVIILAFALYGWFSGIYNSFVAKDETVNQSFAQVQTQYQRRTDLIPNLVATVQGAANFERGTLEAVINARSRATQVTIDPRNITPEKFAEFQQAQSGLSSALSRLLVVTENYPQLQATNQFGELRSQLEGTENRIAVERRRYNETVQDYNTYLKRIPNNFVAGFTSYKERPYFQADAAAQTAPKVNFGTPAPAVEPK